jgi:integrase
MALTDTACKNAACPEGKAVKRYPDAASLYLEVRANGGKYWFWKYRFAGKEKRLALGVYPEVSLRQARLDRDEARKLLKAEDPQDPAQRRREKKLAVRLRTETTFEGVARAWWEQWKGNRSARHADYVLRRLEADVFPEIGASPISGITAKQLLAVSKKIEARGAVDIAKRAFQMSGQVLRYAVAHGVIDRDPSKDVKPGDGLKPRSKANFARVDEKELPELMRKIMAYEGSTVTRFALQLMALTFVRTSELIGARWDEFDLDGAQWRIPAERMKKRRPHIVPLSLQALEVLRYLREVSRGELLFPGERDHEVPMSNNTILGALYRMGYKGRMTGHGFRGVASTMLHEMGFRHDYIELQLAHQQDDETSAAYNYATYLRERGKMMQHWADYLDAAKQGGNVLPFKARHAA